MDADDMEIECPVCDQKVRADAARCPYCGAEFAMSGVDELERVAREMNGQPLTDGPPLEAQPPGAPGAVAVTEPSRNEDKEDKGFFGKLFRKKR